MGHSYQAGRRKFLTNSLKAAGVTALIGLPQFSMAGDLNFSKKDYTGQDLIDIILKEIPGAPFPNTVDTIKCGNASNKVSGIVTTMFPTVNVIEATAKLKANFIIAHEPTFYNHEDNRDFVPNNRVVAQKIELLQQYGITIWRFHDGWHAHNPDGIFHGVLMKTNWLQYYEPGKSVLKIPATTVKAIIEKLKSTLGIKMVRMIGNPDQICERISLIPGAAGAEMQIGLVENERPDLLIVGELREWETAEYIRDRISFGEKTALIVLGHAQSEEAGMEWLVEWLAPRVPGLTITHLASDNPFSWV